LTYIRVSAKKQILVKIVYFQKKNLCIVFFGKKILKKRLKYKAEARVWTRDCIIICLPC